MLASSTG